MRRIALLVAVALLAGCAAVGPNYKRPPVSVPDQVYGQNGPSQAESLADVPWFEVFQDPVLRSLIEEALRNGYDPKIAAARLEEARARFRIAESEKYPSVDYQAGYTRARANGEDASAWSADVAVGWEVDLWGRIRRLNESARAQFLATDEAFHGVVLDLVAQVAAAYFELRELDQELVIAKRARDSFQDTYKLFQQSLSGGVASALEATRAEVSVANFSAQIPIIEREIVAQENELSFLLGRVPGPIPRGIELDQQPLPPAVPAGLPSALLMRRPDLRQSEQLLIAANANIGVAQAAFYPTLSLTGLFGGRSSDLTDVLSGKGPAISLGAGLVGPIFQGGRLKAQHRVAVAQFEQARLIYEQDILNALGEVSTALVALEKLGEAETERTHAVTANLEAVRLVNLRYKAGLSAYFEVLDAMQQLFITELSLANLRRDWLLALVQFYRVLGGGWEVTDSEQAVVPRLDWSGAKAGAELAPSEPASTER